MIRITGRILCFRIIALATFVKSDPRPTQVKLSQAAQTKFVICDHTIESTYIRMKQGWMYLVAILDWFSRYVVSWELDQSLELPFVLRAVDRALAQAKPLICNSDQGGHFTSPQYLDRLRPFDIQISMDGRGRALDNIFTERLWRSVKYEEVYLNEYLNPRETRLGLSRYFDFYNNERPHQALGYLTPVRLYFQPSPWLTQVSNFNG
jgi:putative transposase